MTDLSILQSGSNLTSSLQVPNISINTSISIDISINTSISINISINASIRINISINTHNFCSDFSHDFEFQGHSWLDSSRGRLPGGPRYSLNLD